MTIGTPGPTGPGPLPPAPAGPAPAAAAPTAPAAPAAPTAPASAIAGDQVTAQVPAWHAPAPPSATSDNWPAYVDMFGHQPFVSNTADPHLNDLMKAAIAADPSLAKPPISTALQGGHIDAEAVKALQNALKARGYDLGPAGVDGKLGPKTYAALVGFLEGHPPDHPGPAPGPTPHIPPPGVLDNPPHIPPPGVLDLPPDPPAPQPPAHGGPATVTNTHFDPNYHLGNPPPAGYHAMQQAHVSPEVAKMAHDLLGKPFGTETFFEVDGKRYVARNEPHYHPPGFKGGPNGWHSGVTVYEAG